VIPSASSPVVIPSASPLVVPPTAPAAARSFLFTYAVTVTGLPPEKVARVWMPVPPSDEDQDVRMVHTDLPPGNRLTQETQYGNQILYAEAKAGAAGTVALTATYRVTRKEVRGETPAHETKVKLARFLQPDAKVPVGGKPLELLRGRALPADEMGVARALYEVVNTHMRYGKEGVGWGEGDAVWACDSRYGNCSDFHSLFISLARAKQLPAKFEIGFPLPTERGHGEVAGYHCWAKFRPTGKGWVPVDISEANKNPQMRDYYFGNLTENRVTFSTGRDLDLVPRQAGPTLNFFIYPHVEVDGAVYPAGKVQRKFTYRDVPADPAK
jgi:transglutaminase-like putative cysteine protease